MSVGKVRWDVPQEIVPDLSKARISNGKANDISGNRQQEAKLRQRNICVLFDVPFYI